MMTVNRVQVAARASVIVLTILLSVAMASIATAQERAVYQIGGTSDFQVVTPVNSATAALQGFLILEVDGTDVTVGKGSWMAGDPEVFQDYSASFGGSLEGRDIYLIEGGLGTLTGTLASGSIVWSAATTTTVAGFHGVTECIQSTGFGICSILEPLHNVPGSYIKKKQGFELTNPNFFLGNTTLGATTLTMGSTPFNDDGSAQNGVIAITYDGTRVDTPSATKEVYDITAGEQDINGTVVPVTGVVTVEVDGSDVRVLGSSYLVESYALDFSAGIGGTISADVVRTFAGGEGTITGDLVTGSVAWSPGVTLVTQAPSEVGHFGWKSCEQPSPTGICSVDTDFATGVTGSEIVIMHPAASNSTDILLADFTFAGTSIGSPFFPYFDTGTQVSLAGTPVPEPGFLVGILAGAGVLASFRRGRTIRA